MYGANRQESGGREETGSEQLLRRRTVLPVTGFQLVVIGRGLVSSGRLDGWTVARTAAEHGLGAEPSERCL